MDETEDADLLIFDNLEWEVECTSEVWKAMRDKRVPQALKQRVVKCIHLLAQGEWKPVYCQPVSGFQFWKLFVMLEIILLSNYIVGVEIRLVD